MNQEVLEWAKLGVSAIAPIVAAALVVAGWQRTHGLSAERDRANKRRELRIGMMLEAYRVLVSLASRDLAKEDLPVVAAAFENVQLLGTPTQVRHAKKVIVALDAAFSGEGGLANMDRLLAELRQAIRSDLGLEDVDDSLLHLKFSPRSTDNP